MTSPASSHAQAPSIWRDAAWLEVHGSAAADFLQGYLTCETQRINTTSATPMAICNVKGRVLASGWAIGLADGVGLIVHRTVSSAIAQFLKPYITFSPCTLAADDEHHVAVSDAPPGVELLTGLYVTVTKQPPPGATDASARLTNALIKQGFAFVSAAVTEKFLPQMLGLDEQGAVDFDKGCYLGQEIVARAKFRGAVKRRLVQFSWRDERPVVGDDWQGLGTVIDVGDEGSGLALARISGN